MLVKFLFVAASPSTGKVYYDSCTGSGEVHLISIQIMINFQPDVEAKAFAGLMRSKPAFYFQPTINITSSYKLVKKMFVFK